MYSNDFTSLDYLLYGNNTQKEIFFELKKSNIFEKLKIYDPILVGTYPINISIKSSDLDIILYTKNFDELNNNLKTLFSDFPLFTSVIKIKKGNRYLKCNFKLNSYTVEIYAENIPTKKQFGYLHMIKEHEILLTLGEEFRKEIIKLKQEGYKTEPAFAKLLNIKGDPYTNLLLYDIKKQVY